MAAQDVTGEEGMFELVERHRPLLKFDAQEPYLAISAGSIVVNPSNALIRHDDTVLGRVDREGHGLSLELLADYPGSLTPHPGDRLDEAPDVLTDARRMQDDPAIAERAYGRAVVDGPWLWLQYFSWEYYNPKHLLGFGKHEGDWELVQIGLDADQVPRVATYAQHSGGAGRAWEEVEREREGDAEYPVVYVAPFSHASYFEARTHWHPGGPDTPDGKGHAYRPLIERFGAWATWPGRWGNSTGVLGGRLGGRSPRSPGAQTGRWDRPTSFHDGAQRRRPFGAVGKALVLPRAPRRCLIRASAFNTLRQRSETAETTVEQG